MEEQAAIERGINNHLITPGQVILVRRINMREGGEGGFYASTYGEKKREEEGGGYGRGRFKWIIRPRYLNHSTIALLHREQVVSATRCTTIHTRPPLCLPFALSWR